MIRKYIIEPLESEKNKIVRFQESIPEETLCYQLIDLKIAVINFWLEFCKLFWRKNGTTKESNNNRA